jgi:hypothetical protein
MSNLSIKIFSLFFIFNLVATGCALASDSDSDMGSVQERKNLAQHTTHAAPSVTETVSNEMIRYNSPSSSYLPGVVGHTNAFRPTPKLISMGTSENAPSENQWGGMAFRLGFEFQESNGLCPWALTNSIVDKECLFKFHTTKFPSSYLWHVVIDTNDIEFVTRDFSFEEKDQLDLCLTTLNEAFWILYDLLHENGSTTFGMWIDKLEDKMSNGSFFIKKTKTYQDNFIENAAIVRPSAQWTPFFSPQVTIQHPLEYTIPLYFGLFGFDSRYMPVFCASLPHRDLFLDAYKRGDKEKFIQLTKDYCSEKVNGLLFLHALTMVEMSPVDDPFDIKKTMQTGSGLHGQKNKHARAAIQANIKSFDTNALNTTNEHFKRSAQVDTKAKLLLMSRRPFSSMFKEIKPKGGTYEKCFTSALCQNNERFKDIPRLFNRTDYGEQFFDPITHTVKSLTGFLPLFKNEFVEKNYQSLTDLLKNGVITTTMLRNLKEDVKMLGEFTIPNLLEQYFQLALKTVDTPNYTVTIDPDNLSISCIPYEFDILSPPCFLSLDNSMGGFKYKAIQKEYGEAVIEVRGISDVQPWFLRKCGLDENLSGHFLQSPGPGLKNQGLKLFDFLTGFGTDADFYQIFALGMPAALKKN